MSLFYGVQKNAMPLSGSDMQAILKTMVTRDEDINWRGAEAAWNLMSLGETGRR